MDLHLFQYNNIFLNLLSKAQMQLTSKRYDLFAIFHNLIYKFIYHMSKIEWSLR